MGKQIYILPYREFRKLHVRAYRAQQHNHAEICGIIVVGPDKKIELQFLKNTRNAPYQYELNINDIRLIQQNVMNEQKKILGTFHTHPIGKAMPGSGDLEKGFYKGIEMIYDVCAREVKLWRLKKKKEERSAEEVQLIVEGTTKNHC